MTPGDDQKRIRMSIDDGYIEVVQGDITRQHVDAIVNAANSSLLGGGGVDGAIHRVAGPELLESCRRIGGCPPGEARITPGFQLPAQFVIHTVGPIWRGGGHGEDETLARCYRNSMALAAQHHVRSIAFPSISTGAYGFPVERAARIAVRELRDAVDRYPEIETVRVVCFGRDTYTAYEHAINDLLD
jgi:O-acetyl-ADP-ribose deacetylase (regulator of RNase III)